MEQLVLYGINNTRKLDLQCHSCNATRTPKNALGYSCVFYRNPKISLSLSLSLSQCFKSRLQISLQRCFFMNDTNKKATMNSVFCNETFLVLTNNNHSIYFSHAWHWEILFWLPVKSYGLLNIQLKEQINYDGFVFTIELRTTLLLLLSSLLLLLFFFFFFLRIIQNNVMYEDTTFTGMTPFNFFFKYYYICTNFSNFIFIKLHFSLFKQYHLLF